MPAAGTASYTATQMVYTFTFSANAAGSLSFDNTSGGGLAALQRYVTTVETAILADTTIQGLIGTDWTPVWGPVVYVDDTSGATVHADNTMGCYYSPSNNLFVVAVAGTNPNSPFDWLNEDFDVHTMVAWTAAGGTGAGNISAGANAGLQILLGMTDQGATMLQALASYIATNQVAGATIAVGGHSLGGALSPCLALYMYDNQSALGLSGQSLSAFPTAGPTPGDSGFATTYDAVIAAKGITYASLYNTLDVVPLAWAESDLATIPTIYDADIPPAKTDSPADDFMGIVACGLQLNALSAVEVILKHDVPINPYTQVSKGRASIAGTFNTTIDGDVTTKLKYLDVVLPEALQPYAATLTNAIRFAAQAAWQHAISYPSLPGIDIPAFETEYQVVLANNKPTSAAPVDGMQATVKRLTGIDLGRITPLLAAAAAKARATR